MTHTSREKTSFCAPLLFSSLGRRAIQGIAVGVGAGLISLTAMGQETPVSSSSNAATPQMEEVVVTGSMIKRVNAETAEAVTIVKMDALKDLGVTTVEQ